MKTKPHWCVVFDYTCTLSSPFFLSFYFHSLSLSFVFLICFFILYVPTWLQPDGVKHCFCVGFDAATPSSVSTTEFHMLVLLSFVSSPSWSLRLLSTHSIYGAWLFCFLVCVCGIFWEYFVFVVLLVVYLVYVSGFCIMYVASFLVYCLYFSVGIVVGLCFSLIVIPILLLSPSNYLHFYVPLSS